MAKRKKKKRKRTELSEDEAQSIAENDHPEWHRQLREGTLPDEIVGEDGEPMKPILHLTIHAIVERQLAANDPKGIVAIAWELERLGVSRHEIRHVIGRAVVTQMCRMRNERLPFDEHEYLDELREAIRSYD